MYRVEKKKEKNYPLGESEVLLFILLHVVYTRRIRVARYDRSLIGDNLKEKEKKRKKKKDGKIVSLVSVVDDDENGIVFCRRSFR